MSKPLPRFSIRSYLLTLCWLLAGGLCQAQALVLDDPHRVYYLEPLFVFTDTPTHIRDYDQLKNLPGLRWQQAYSGLRAGFTDRAYWYRIDLLAVVDRPIWTALVDNALLDNMDAFLVLDGQVVKHWHWQDKYSVSEHSYAARPAFDLQLQPQLTYSLYLRAESQFSLFMPLSLGADRTVTQFFAKKITFLYFFYGIMAALLIYSLVIAITIGSRATYHYCVYLALILAYNMHINGNIRGWDAPLADRLDQFLVYGISLGVFVSALFFTRSFLKMQQKSGPFYWGYWLLLLLMAATGLAAIVGANSLFIKGLQLVSPLFFVYALAAGFCSIRAGNRYAWLFEAGWLAMALGTLIHQMLLSGYLPTMFVTQEAMRIGAMLEAFMLSWALALRFKSMRDSAHQLEAKYKDQLVSANSQLREALRLENASNELKEDFIRVVGHELRTPVNTLVSALDLLSSQPDRYSQKQFQHDAMLALNRLYNQVENLVVASELTGQRAFSTPSWFDLGELLEPMIAHFHQQLHDKPELKFEHQLPPAGTEVFADRSKLERIFYNLLDNACKFTSKGQIQLQVQADGARLVLRLQDSGQGMKQSQIDNAYQFIAQEDRSYLRKNEGFGLGLSTTWGLVNLLSGSLEVQSELAKGTLVQLRLFVQSRLGALPLASMTQPQRRLRVLLVEDNPLNAKLMLKVFEQLDLQVLCADQGEQAVELASQYDFDLVIMDLQMPVMDGFTAIRNIRALSRQHQQWPILAVSANSSSKDIQLAMQAGATEFVAKPIRPARLKQLVAVHVANSR